MACDGIVFTKLPCVLAVGCAGGVIEQVVQGSESQNPAKV